MPYLKFSRDKRGYEHFALVEPGAPRRGKPPRPRVLFMFRTPPQLKVGRHPFTEDVRRALEEQNPGMRFDWPRLLATPIPPPDAEHWRERRRAEKAAKQAAREAEASEHEAAEHEAAEPEAAEQAPQMPGGAPDDAEVLEGVASSDAGSPADPAGIELASSDVGAAEPQAPAVAGSQPPGDRRRRRRRRRRRPGASAQAPAAEPPADPGPPTDEV